MFSNAIFFFTQKSLRKSDNYKSVLKENYKVLQEFVAERHRLWLGAPEHIHVLEGT